MAVISRTVSATWRGPRSRRGALGTAIGLTGGAAVLAACGASGSGAEQGAPGASGRLVELRTHARAGSEKDGYQKNVDAFNEQYGGRYRATYEPIAGNLYEGQEVLMAGGTIGDVHYAQDDCEASGTAIQGRSRVHLRFAIRKGPSRFSATGHATA